MRESSDVPAAATLSARARRAGAAYAGPGSGSQGPERYEHRPITFTVGLPDPDLLPAAELADAFSKVLATETEGALQYGGSQGYEPVREWLARRWSAIDKVDLTPAHFAMANGSAGALINICETFLDQGDVVAVEAPSFPGSIRAIRSITPRVESIPVDGDGLDADSFEERLRDVSARGERMRMLYAIPNFHNPTGSTLTIDRRRRLLEVCRSHNVLIVEDDAYGELWFDEPPPPSFYALSSGEGVVKIDTFSKIVAPGLRAGWAQATPEVTAALVATRSDMGTSPLVLRALARLTESGFVDHHIERGRHLYAQKRGAVLAGLREHCTRLATWNEPDGGFFIWMTLADEIDPTKLAATTREECVSFVSGRIFYAEQGSAESPRLGWGPAGDSRHLRIAFSAVALDDIAEGTRRLGQALTAARA